MNSAVSYFEKPALGKVNPKIRYMALSIDRKSKSPYIGVAREITKSKGSVDIPGFLDKSKLILVQSSDGLNWKKIKDLEIRGIKSLIRKLDTKDKYFIGLEDPDIWQDEKGIRHVYFTIAFKCTKKPGYIVYLGHAQGNSFETLKTTPPVLKPIKSFRGFKEVSISILNKKQYRINLVESLLFKKGNEVSMISTVKSEDMSKPWKHLRIALNPKNMKYKWCKGHLSSCCFLPKSFINNNNLLIGIINGREPKQIIKGQRIYGKFRPGLILFNPETGEIPWISKKPLFEDPDARTITFASDFIQTKADEGILYAHVNDSFVRAYKINAKELRKLLPKIKTNNP